MPDMSVTLEVSKLSGWLNDDAPCRESKGGHTQCGPGEAAGDGGASSVRGRARLQIWARGLGGAHVEHVVHASDAGGVEAQRLVERRRFLCRESKGGHAVRGELRALGGAGGSGGRRCPKQRAQERARLQIGSRALGEERTLNMPFIFVTLEVSKLSGWLNTDESCRESKGEHAVRGEVDGSAGAREAGATAAQAQRV